MVSRAGLEVVASSASRGDVFIASHGLPERWHHREAFTVLDTAFGKGDTLLAVWSTWRDDPQRCGHLLFIGITPSHLSAAADTDIARRLGALWPPQTPGWHHVSLDKARGAQGQFQHLSLMLGFGEPDQLLPGLLASVDAFCIDGTGCNNGIGALAPTEAPAPGWVSRLNRLAAPGATAVASASPGTLPEALRAAQFVVSKAPETPGSPHFMRAQHAPRFTAQPAPGGLWPAPAPEHRHAMVLGAGLAGCSAAWSLSRQGWAVTLLDAADGPAQGASGNPGGLFHSIVHGDDGLHARAHRAAALATWARVKEAISEGEVPGQATGLLRLDPRQDRAGADAMLARMPWLTEQARWLDQTDAQAWAGAPVPSGGWLFRQAGWLEPAAYARWLLKDAHSFAATAPSAQTSAHSAGVRTQWSCAVARIHRDDDTAQWQALDAHGRLLAQAPTLVLATAWQANELLATLPSGQATEPLPLSAVRGQITWLQGRHGTDAVSLPTGPVAGGGYALTLPGGRLLCGATTQHHDTDPSIRPEDHRHNLAQAKRLGVMRADPGAHHTDGTLPHTHDLAGRVGWRATTPDRLPLVGALPWHADRLTNLPHLRREQVRMLPRERSASGGLYVLSGLGSRGITWAALAGELLAHWVTGAACPVEAELRDAMDPARFLARRHRS